VSLDNLGDLSTAVAEWLYRATDSALTARAEDLIALFEADFVLDPEMRPLDMEEVDTTVIGSSAAFPLPAGFLDMKLLRVLGGAIGLPDYELTFVPAARAAQLDGAQLLSSGIAKNYTIRAGRIFLTPQRWVPTGATLELTYNKFTSLADAPGHTNWLLQKYPNIYLYGSLMQAAAYIDDKNTVTFWKAGRDEALSKLASLTKKQKHGASPLILTPSSASFK
jgi:hypothetical protein